MCAVVTQAHSCRTHVGVHACVCNGDKLERESVDMDIKLAFFQQGGLIIKGPGNSVGEQQGWRSLGPALQAVEEQVQRL